MVAYTTPTSKIYCTAPTCKLKCQILLRTFLPTIGVVKVDFPEISRDLTNFNHLYLRAPGELDKKKPHFRAFQERRFSTHIFSSETKKLQPFEDSNKMQKFDPI